jgi:hypothetical protein
MTPERTWYGRRDGPFFAFISRAPLTLGHSQLRVATPNVEGEAARWSLALPRFIAAIDALERVMRQPLGAAWSAVAEYTETHGAFVRTLVLRTSAAEKTGDPFRVHLVPLFESHAEGAAERFRLVHDLEPPRTGGLIGWLGDREKVIDREIEVPNVERAELAPGLDALTVALRAAVAGA